MVGWAAWQGAINHCIVIRGNKLLNNAGIDVRGHVLNCVVDGNIISNSSVGIHVDRTNAAGVLVGENNVCSVGKCLNDSTPCALSGYSSQCKK